VETGLQNRFFGRNTVSERVHGKAQQEPGYYVGSPGNVMTTRLMESRVDADMPGSSSAEPGSSAELPPLGTLDEIAYQMTHTFWGGSSHRFNVTQGGTITVNLTGITEDGRTVARAALEVWSDIIGVTFQEVTTGGQIKFDDLAIGTGAFSESQWGADGYTVWATVNVSPARLGNGPGIMRGGLHTYIHEIGHALGLGHTAFANSGTAAATYPNDALWRNDGSAVSVMSYFDNAENTYYANQGFTHNLITTPMVSDIIAVGNLYGLSTTTRTGDTTYGFNNNSGREMFDAALHPHLAYTIFDSGGIDTLDYSGFGTNQRINLNAEAFSNIGWSVGNVVIARGTVIENAIGGSGADTIIGNSADNILTGKMGNDVLTGSAGADTFRDTAAGLNGDTIVDFSTGDRIIFTDANGSTFSFSLSGNTLTFTGGSLTLGIVPAGTIIASAAAGGGVQLSVRGAYNDFNGDGRSDVLWRHDDGTVTNWLAQPNGGFVANGANAWYGVPVSWTIAGTGDFNGDGRDDILWRHDDGSFTNWLAQSNGSFVANAANAWFGVPVSWQVAGTGDFNGDGRDDILWRNDNGQLGQWLGTSTGGFADNGANAFYGVPTDWTVAAVGDFNGDGRSDILWRNDNGLVTEWLGTQSGAFVANNAHVWAQVDNAWQVVGTGDFNGDGRADILWRNTSGDLTNWLGQSTGGFIANDANSRSMVDNSWNVAAIGDANGDGRDDIIWRNDSGAFTDWLGQPNGGFAVNDANAAQNVPISWHVQPADLWG
jgi:hypothetical protein